MTGDSVRNSGQAPASHTPQSFKPADDLPRAIAFMLIAISVLAFLDSFAKLNGQSMPVLQVTWLRFAVHFVLVSLIFNPWRSPTSWKVSNWKLQLLRSCMMVMCTGLNFAALGYLQVAQALSIQFTTPIFVTILSIFILGERVGRYRWIGIFVGFFGILVITRPGFDSFHWAFGLTLGSVIVGSGYIILTRTLAGTESSTSMLLMMAAVPTALLMPVMPFVWVWPENPIIYAQIVAMGIFGATSHGCLILAHKYAPASVLAPFQYFQFLVVLVVGYVMFGDIPDFFTYVGAAIVVGSGLFIWWRDRTAKAKALAMETNADPA